MRTENNRDTGEGAVRVGAMDSREGIMGEEN
jgi:hypothetical protein